MPGLLVGMAGWAQGSLLERRAAAAGLCEPALLQGDTTTLAVFAILDRITESLRQEPDPSSPDFKALRKALGYCWSVAVAALPDQGKGRIERWIGDHDRQICWVMKENLKKKRLLRLDPVWVEAQRGRLQC